ncbi:MAG: carbohydrate-binding domain-containing protein [Candidatus Krumholzibacteriia bacterium]|nr:carbohydrate-binding domain-containing protein [bacterium]MCB9512758.1 carbohydrate-binding domain-containing protein [Candidatus Latescibacterota bacterium]MCB9516844.1 carbohydrate-binding domain-containing protein [Candidatus Latescibacterota bacterium]
MKRLLALLLLALCVAPLAVAQEMDVLGLDGETDTYALDSIESVTFDLSGLRADGDLLRLHTQGGLVQLEVADIDSVTFAAGTLLRVHQALGVTSQFALADIDSITFANSADLTVTVDYAGGAVTVVNPLESAGVAVDVTGADVIVSGAAGMPGIVYALSGTTGDGMFKIYSDEDFTLRLDGVSIENLDGPAINVQADVTIGVALLGSSTLTDGVTYADPPNDEDQKAAFFSEGQLIFTGAGSLTVNGQGDDQHGLGSDDYIEVQGGTIIVTSAVKDGVHTNEGYFQHGGSVSVSADADGVDAGDGPVTIDAGTLTVLIADDDRDAVKCDGAITIAGGNTQLTVEGDQSKGLNAGSVLLTGGLLTIQTSGGVVLEASGAGFDPSYCTAIKADDLVELDGADVTVTTVGLAGRGVSCDGDIAIASGVLDISSSGDGGVYVNDVGLADAYHGPCLKADANVILTGGTITLSHSGSGGKGISGDFDLSIGVPGTGPTLNITTTGAPISIGGGDYAEAKAVSVDSTVTIDGGDITISSADDAIKSKRWLEVNGGLINIVNSVEGLESPNLFINGGEIHLTSTDDGLNATYGVDGEFNDGSNLTISGGYIHLYAPAGDAIDSNGNLTLAGGTLIVHGPPAQPEVGIDVNGTFRVDGGFTVVSQINSNMVETPSSQSTQRCVLLKTNTTLSAGTLFHIEDTGGGALVTFRPANRYSCILLSTVDLTAGTSYRVYTGGSCTGSELDGLYSGGTYSGGTLRTTFTSAGMVQTVNF